MQTKPPTTTTTTCQVYGQLSQIGPRLLEVLRGLEARGIPADIDFDLSFSPEQLAACRRWHERGNLVAPNVYPFDLDPACTNANWWSYSEEECGRLMSILRTRLADIGLEDVKAINTYTPGNGFVRAAQHGFHYLLGFCAPIVSHDTHWQISQVGCPIGPYFAGSEDYRKPASPGVEPGFVIASMELRNPLTCFHHWSEGPFCPLNLLLGDRTVETGEWPVETMAASEDFLRQSELSGEARFFHINLQYFSSRKCFDFNERMLDWLASQARMGRLRFTGLAEHAKTLRATGGVLPQSTWWRGENMGQHCGARRGDGIEAIISEDAAGQWQFRSGHAGPERFFDYRKPWNYPAYDPKGQLPASENYTVRVSRQPQKTSDRSAALEVSVDPVDGGGMRRFCLWKILPGLRGPFHLEHLDDNVRCVSLVPHPGGAGLSVILEADLTSALDFRLVVGFDGPATRSSSKQWADLVIAETVDLFDQPLTRVSSTAPYPLQVSLRPTAAHPVRTSQILGGTWSEGVLKPGETWHGTLDGSRSVSVVRFWGISADALQMSPEAECDLTAQAERRTTELAHHGDQTIKAGSILRFGPDAPAWTAEAARRGADREIERTNAIALERAGKNKIVAALHMACDLPFGSKGRAGSSFYDRHEVHGAEAFFPIFYDYGQSYFPGVAGWNQFWRINLGVRGLDPDGNYKVVLHTYDPEARGTMCRLSATACDHEAHVNLSPEVVLGPPFLACQGLEQRFSNGAFVVHPLPDLVVASGAANIHLYSDSDQAAYDRFTERPGFAFLSHAWLIKCAQDS